jgi:hypothetical protein
MSWLRIVVCNVQVIVIIVLRILFVLFVQVGIFLIPVIYVWHHLTAQLLLIALIVPLLRVVSPVIMDILSTLHHFVALLAEMGLLRGHKYAMLGLILLLVLQIALLILVITVIVLFWP